MGGSGVIHVTGGLIALIAAIIIGPRHGRFYDDERKPLAKPGYIRNFCPSFLLLGVFVAWVGWYVVLKFIVASLLQCFGSFSFFGKTQFYHDGTGLDLTLAWLVTSQILWLPLG